MEETRQRIERRGECRYVYLWPKNRRRHKFILHAPSEHSLGATDLVINVTPADALADQRLPHVLQREWAEVLHGRVTVETTDRPEHEANLVQLFDVPVVITTM